MLVRRVQAGLSWHPATDQLSGSEPAYGMPTQVAVGDTFILLTHPLHTY